MEFKFLKFRKHNNQISIKEIKTALIKEFFLVNKYIHPKGWSN